MNIDKNVALSCVVIQVDEDRCTVVLFNSKAMNIVVLLCLFIQHQWTSLYCHYFLFGIDQHRSNAVLFHSKSMKINVRSWISIQNQLKSLYSRSFSFKSVKIIIPPCFCIQNHKNFVSYRVFSFKIAEHHCTIVLFSSEINEHRCTVVRHRSKSMKIIVLSCCVIGNGWNLLYSCSKSMKINKICCTAVFV